MEIRSLCQLGCGLWLSARVLHKPDLKKPESLFWTVRLRHGGAAFHRWGRREGQEEEGAVNLLRHSVGSAVPVSRVVGWEACEHGGVWAGRE